MPWYDVYDNVEVQWLTRRQAAAATCVVSAVLGAGAAGVILGLLGVVPLSPVAAAALIACIPSAWLYVRRIQRLRRIVWCIKISREEIVGFDYARRKRAVAWENVKRVEVGDGCLLIAGPHPATLEVTHRFNEYHLLSHRIVHLAERRGVPVLIDGMPWQQIDVYAVYPFLSPDESSPTRGSTAV